MDSADASRVKQRTARKINMLSLFLKGLWITTVLFVWRGVERIRQAPYLLRRGLTPMRAVSGITLLSLIVTPVTLYFVEKGRHVETRRAYRALSVSAASETDFLRSTLKGLLEDQFELTNMLLDSGSTVYSGDKVLVKVVATGYSSSVYETDATPFTTAANTTTREGILALSRDLLTRYTPGAPFSFGDEVHISGLGDFLVEDTMNARWTNRVDVWFPTRTEAIRFGVREVYLSGTPERTRQIDPDILSQNGPGTAVSNEL